MSYLVPVLPTRQDMVFLCELETCLCPKGTSGCAHDPASQEVPVRDTQSTRYTGQESQQIQGPCHVDALIRCSSLR